MYISTLFGLFLLLLVQGGHFLYLSFISLYWDSGVKYYTDKHFIALNLQDLCSIYETRKGNRTLPRDLRLKTSVIGSTPFLLLWFWPLAPSQVGCTACLLTARLGTDWSVWHTKHLDEAETPRPMNKPFSKTPSISAGAKPFISCQCWIKIWPLLTPFVVTSGHSCRLSPAFTC